MTMSVDLQYVHDIVSKHNEKLKATDFKPNQVVQISLKDGGFYQYISAFIKIYLYGDTQYIVVFIEYDEFQIFEDEEINHYLSLEMKYIRHEKINIDARTSRKR